MSYIPDTSAQDTQIKQPKNNQKKWLWAGAIGVFFVFFVIVILPALQNWTSGTSAIAADKLRLATVQNGEFVRDLSVQGKVVAARRPVLYSPAQGTVTYLVEAGDSVVKGQALASIESPELQSLFEQENTLLARLNTQLAREKIQVKQQQLEYENRIGQAQVLLHAAKREMRRSEEAMKNQVISDIDYQKAKDDLANAQREFKHVNKEVALLKESQQFEIQTRQLELTSQQVKVAELERQVNSLHITSPVAGLVGNLALEQKNTVSKNQALLSVVDLSQYQLEVQIPESYADDLALGMIAEVSLNQQLLAGELVAISPEIRQGRVQGKVRFTEQNTLALRQNQRLTTRLILEQKTGIDFLPRGQFINTYNGQYAYVMRDGKAVKTPIKLGSKSLAKVEIISGLAVGDTVVVSDNDVFKDAPSVRVLQ